MNIKYHNLKITVWSTLSDDTCGELWFRYVSHDIACIVNCSEQMHIYVLESQSNN